MKPSQYFSLMAALLALSIPASAMDAGEWVEVSVPNASFEEGESLPLGWRVLKGNRPRPSLATVFAWDKEFARTGQRSVYIRREGAGPLRWTTIDPVVVKPGYEHELTVWYRANPSPRGAVRVSLESSEKGADGKPWATSREVAIPTSETDWQPLTLTFTPPEGVEAVRILLFHTGSSRTGQTNELWFDDVSLRRRPVQAQ